MTESRRKIDNCSFHLFVATLENLGPLNRTFTVLKTVPSVFHIWRHRQVDGLSLTVVDSCLTLVHSWTAFPTFLPPYELRLGDFTYSSPQVLRGFRIERLAQLSFVISVRIIQS